jgi:hypothetical protein
MMDAAHCTGLSLAVSLQVSTKALAELGNFCGPVVQLAPRGRRFTDRHALLELLEPRSKYMSLQAEFP